MVKQGLRMIPHINGAIHIMANPTYSYDYVKIVENGQRKRLLPATPSLQLHVISFDN